jgi:hypothetical protein
MNTTHNTKTKRLIAALGVAAAAAVAPALLFAGAGTAHAAPCAETGNCSPFPTIPKEDLDKVRAADPGESGGSIRPPGLSEEEITGQPSRIGPFEPRPGEGESPVVPQYPGGPLAAIRKALGDLVGGERDGAGVGQRDGAGVGQRDGPVAAHTWLPQVAQPGRV